MKQGELELFVGKLADAEQEAAKSIEKAENDSRNRLKRLEQRLRRKKEAAIKALDVKLAGEAKRLEKETKEKNRILDDAMDKRIEEMQARHDKRRQRLVDWAVKRISGL